MWLCGSIITDQVPCHCVHHAPVQLYIIDNASNTPNWARKGGLQFAYTVQAGGIEYNGCAELAHACVGSASVCLLRSSSMVFSRALNVPMTYIYHCPLSLHHWQCTPMMPTGPRVPKINRHWQIPDRSSVRHAEGHLQWAAPPESPGH